MTLRATTGISHPYGPADTLGSTGCKWESHFHSRMDRLASEPALELLPCPLLDVGTRCPLCEGQDRCFLFLHRESLCPPRFRDFCRKERRVFRRQCKLLLVEALLKWLEFKAINCYLFRAHSPKIIHLLRAKGSHSGRASKESDYCGHCTWSWERKKKHSVVQKNAKMTELGLTSSGWM